METKREDLHRLREDVASHARGVYPYRLVVYKFNFLGETTCTSVSLCTRSHKYLILYVQLQVNKNCMYMYIWCTCNIRIHSNWDVLNLTCYMANIRWKCSSLDNLFSQSHSHSVFTAMVMINLRTSEPYNYWTFGFINL